MKEYFQHHSITAKRAADINLINAVLEEYSAQKYVLTVRQLYYQLVGRGEIENIPSEYTKVMRNCTIGRQCGLIDWAMIEDRSREINLPYCPDGIENALNNVIHNYRLDRQDDQKYNIEIWTEKDAVSNILKRVSRYYHISLVVDRGYSSSTFMYDAYHRMEGGRPTIILYVGDHDPSGLDMIRDIETRLNKFRFYDFEIVHVALTMEQIKKYNPPPNPTKMTDPRAWRYTNQHGQSSWELDALEPKVLKEIVKDAVKNHLDEKIFKKIMKREKSDLEILENAVETAKLGLETEDDDDDNGNDNGDEEEFEEVVEKVEKEVKGQDFSAAQKVFGKVSKKDKTRFQKALNEDNDMELFQSLTQLFGRGLSRGLGIVPKDTDKKDNDKNKGEKK